MRIAVIGAGSAGLAAIKRCSEASNVEVVCYEKTDKVGGTWVYVPETGKDAYGLPIHSSMYDSLRTNLPKEVMGYPDYPIPANVKSYLHRTEILAFLNDYCDHFKLRDKIRFLHNIELVEPTKPDETEAKGKWHIRVRDLRSGATRDEYFDGVMVCNGHYFEPSLPTLKGREKFKGPQLHSHDYRNAEPFADKRVVVFGAGPSDVFIIENENQPGECQRDPDHGFGLTLGYVFGHRKMKKAAVLDPNAPKNSSMDLALEISKKAKRVILSHHLKETILTKFPDNVVQKKDVVELKENSAVFQDGTEEEIDVMFYCTGYKYSFPFLAESCGVKVDHNMVTPLWNHVIAIENPTLAIIGLPFYVCAFSMFDLQVRFVLRFWLKERALPSREEMLRAEAIEKDVRFNKDGFTKRQFHMMGPLQGSYYDLLANAADLERLPPVLTKLHNESSNRFLDDLVHYREDRYRIVDDENYEKIDV